VRDSAQNITRIDQTSAISLTLDKQITGELAGTMLYQHPILMHLDDPIYGQYGALLAIWSARNTGDRGGNDIRASMVVLGDSPQNAAQAKAWKPPVLPSTLTIGNPAQVAYTVLVNNKHPGINYASAIRKRAGTNAGDLYLFYHDGDTPGEWDFRRMMWSAATGDWSAGMGALTLISPVHRAGSKSGYNLSQQLGSRPVEDPIGDRLYFGFANWKDDTSGDTWSFAEIVPGANDMVGPIVDVYSAGGPHSYAPSGDLAFDTASGQLIVSYVKTGDQHAFVRLYARGSPAGDEISVFDQAPVDIPLLAEQPRYGAPPRLLMVFRDTSGPANGPYHGWAGALPWQ
jgi:hypothetical protein